MQKNRRKRCVIASMFFLITVFFAFGPVSVHLPFLFYFNTTASLPRGFYLKMPVPNHFSDGDYVVYSPPPDVEDFAVSRHWINKDELLLKKIGATSHQKYVIDSDSLQFFANGEYIGQVYLLDRDNLPMPVIRGEHEVPDDEFLPVAEHPRSFDGRYTGTVPIKNIKSKVIPVFTELHW